MTHSFLVTIVGVGIPDTETIEVIFDESVDLIASAGAGARAVGDPADEGVDAAGDAIVLVVKWRLTMVNTNVVDSTVT